ncbi:MAG TPA: 3-phosphoshikimate 1-carboxyvinyltransferase [Pyrinomonadaceae bacterium]|jgi:3-phosphoshikimate 1-carboxyvinyltransferase|nr:3-phosphoshikimate 1-carboxyvinyltransferase [Pyrinomonadaceae bacterium]
MKIEPARRVRGRLRLPGDKSISHRAGIIAALAEGTTRIENFSTSRDCAATLACLSQLGVRIARRGTSVRIEGVGLEGLRAPAAMLDCGNSGSTMRMLAGVLAGQDFVSGLTGDDSLRSRPMKRIIEPLELMGARITSEEGRAPLRIEGRQPLKAITYRMPVASAQVKSCVLLAGLLAEGRTEVIEEGGPTRDHTERMLDWLGVPLTKGRAQAGDAVSEVFAINGPVKFKARDLIIPGDISSAAFFIAAAAMRPGSELLIEDVGLNPTRSQIVSTFGELHAGVLIDERRAVCNEAVGTIRVRGAGGLAPVREGQSNILRGSLIPQLIDELPMLAVVGTQVLGGLRIHDAKELRVKESDRINATVENLRRMGASVEEYEDGLRVSGPTRLRGATLDSYGDHRIAMAFTVAALLAEGESEIIGAECASVSFPEFFQLLETLIER